VSNSSSSSFICCITGEATEIYDGDNAEGTATCVNGHSFFTEDYHEVETFITEGPDEDEDDDEYADRNEVPEHLCPVCDGKTKPLIIKRLKAELADLGITVDDLK